MKKIFFILLCIIQFNYAQRNDAFEKIGDVLTLMPIFVGVVSLGIEDYRGFGELMLGAISTQASIEIIKRSFEYAHKKGYDVSFSKRPCCEDYKGMPSGHSGGAFSAAAFVYYRYGWKPAIPITLLAITTAASRVHARKHTIWQVITGGAIAWSFGWLFTSKYKPKNKNLVFLPSIGVDKLGGTEYSATIKYSF
ncbi:phosphatase PAP2 family protein [Helicobacter anatolicus]|uniref:phosphatase PAP2 family protein n=1 Tax=Helicobacter anatolicus TaxID=2905874 RepID=UPI0022B8CC23|nr:phosphatase PAP2 family protein [Helicobacter anatolicus]